MGPAKTCVVGLAAVVGGYMAMSYTDNLFLLLVEYAVASLGSGTTFLCALSTAIGMGYPIGIALVSSLPCGLAVVTPGELAHLCCVLCGCMAVWLCVATLCYSRCR